MVAKKRSEQPDIAPHTLLTDVLDISGPLNDAAAAIVDDSFLRCFTSAMDDPWNWNFYLLPLWLMGVAIRNLVLFPLRVLTLVIGALLFVLGFAATSFLKGTSRNEAERKMVQFLSRVFVTSWTGVIRYHGPRPAPAANRVWVANHTSMIDYAVLCAYAPFAAIMQLHPGWVGVVQKRYLSALGCLWFNRTQARHRIFCCFPVFVFWFLEGGKVLGPRLGPAAWSRTDAAGGRRAAEWVRPGTGTG